MAYVTPDPQKVEKNLSFHFANHLYFLFLEATVLEFTLFLIINSYE